MAAAHSRGLPLYLMLSGALYTSATPTAHALVGKNSSITGAKDLAGKVIGMNTVRDMRQAATMKWIERDGGDPTTSKYYELPSSEVGGSIENGR